MNKWIIGGVIIIALLAISAGSLTGFFTASAKESVKVADIAITQNLPLYIAVENGYFEDEGLEIEVVRFDSPKQIVDAIILNQVDLAGPGGATGISAIAESLQPNSLKYYAFTCHYENSGNNLLIRKSSNITSIKQLEGKKIGKLPAIQWTTIVNRILKENQVDLKKTTLIDLAPQVQLQALESGQIDALVALDPIGQIGVEKGIAKILVPGVAEKNIADPFCNGAGFISTKFLNERPKAAEKALKAMQRGIEEANHAHHPELLKKYLAMDSNTAEKMDFPLANFIYYSDITPEQKAAVQKFIDMFYEDGVMQKRVFVEDVLLK